MITTILIQQFKKDLSRLANEVNAFEREADLWKDANGISNSAGNLSIHLIGNLNHFVGHVLGKTDYKRDRPFEFEARNIPRAKLLADIEKTKTVIEETLNYLSEEDLKREYPIQIFKDEAPMNTAHMLMHLSNHLNYHLGQINYYRRILAD